MRDRGAARESVLDMMRQKSGVHANMRLERLKTEAKGPYPFSDKQAQYKTYTDEQLYWALRDAGQSARSFRRVSGEESTEGWYLDDVSTICSELRARGLPIPGAMESHNPI